jgi:hypothetical protein
VVIGNPPFLGDKKMRAELGDAYTEALRKTYERRVPGGADLVCYWFEKARAQIETGALGAAGLVATNVDRIAKTTRIFEVWEDQTWVNEGASVRVSLICFGISTQSAIHNGEPVSAISSGLKPLAGEGGSDDLTLVSALRQNTEASFFGLCLAGPFKVPSARAADWLRQPNPNGRPNSDVLKPIFNGADLTRRWAGDWTIDFGARMSEADAALYAEPFTFATFHVLPVRTGNNRASRAKFWWRHGEARPGLRKKLEPLSRYIVTVETAKHRFFVFLPVSVAPEHSLIVIPRADDATFGVLESRQHTVWTMNLGSPYGNHPTARRYNASRTFETFPFPAGLTPLDTAHQRTEVLEGGAVIPAGLADAVSDQNMTLPSPIGHLPLSNQDQSALRRWRLRRRRAAHRLDTLREAWLNPPEWTQRVPEVVPLGLAASPYPDRIEPRPGLSEADLQALKKRTLTNLYNLRPAWLAMAHEQLDAAVAAAYGWGDYTPAMPDEEILRRLLALNRQRSATIAQE